MTVGVGAQGFLGIAPEVTPGTYVAPTKYLVLRNESLQFNPEPIRRRPLRGIADEAAPVAGNFHIEGDIEVDITEDTLVHILRAARMTGVKTGAGDPYTYVFTPNANAVPALTLSITVVRNGIPFGFVGCVVGSQQYSLDSGLLIGSFSIMGRDEASQALPTPTHVTTPPYGPGTWSVEFPTGSPVADTDTFQFSIEDNAEAQWRLRNSRAAAFIKYGERDVKLTAERDFEARTDYDAFKALTAMSMNLKTTRATGPERSIQFRMPAGYKETYEIGGMSGQADLIRASISNFGTYDAATSKSAEITILTAENITPFP